MCYPIRIGVEDGVAEIARLEFIIGIDDGLDAIVLFHDFQPQPDTLLELLVSLVLGLVLDVEDRRQVAILEFYVLDEELGLSLGGRMDAVEMVGTTGKAVLASLIEIVDKVFVDLRGALRSLDHDETHRELVDGAFVLQRLPIDGALVVADVDTVNLVAFRITDVAIKGAETESEGTDEEIIEEIDVGSQHRRSTQPPGPSGHVLQKTDDDVRTMTPRSPIGTRRVDALIADDFSLLFRHKRKTASFTKNIVKLAVKQ